MDRIGELMMEYGPRVVGVLAFLIVSYIIAGWTGKLVKRALTKGKVEQTLTAFFGDAAAG